jgi:hypothetical protein
LDYMMARYYSMNSTRFVSVDPSTVSSTMRDAQTWNRYAYSRNSPVRYIDPNGEVPFDSNSMPQVMKDRISAAQGMVTSHLRSALGDDDYDPGFTTGYNYEYYPEVKFDYRNGFWPEGLEASPSIGFSAKSHKVLLPLRSHVYGAGYMEGGELNAIMFLAGYSHHEPGFEGFKGALREFSARAAQLGVSREEAVAILEIFRNMFPEDEKWQQFISKQQEKAKKGSKTTTGPRSAIGGREFDPKCYGDNCTFHMGVYVNGVRVQ